jgi:hypothetical protein
MNGTEVLLADIQIPVPLCPNFSDRLSQGLPYQFPYSKLAMSHLRYKDLRNNYK